MKTSVAMATYNGAPFIEAQLESIAHQTVPPDEIVISDDGSTDGTLDVVRAWATRHPALRVSVLDGRGPGNYAGNFVRAFAATTGDLVFLCDQDDVWFAKKIEEMSAVMAGDPLAMVAIHDAEITDGALTPIGQRSISRAHAIGSPMRDYTSGMATVVRSDFLQCCLEPPEGMGHDNWIHACARELGTKRVHDVPLAYYRRHAAAVSTGFLMNDIHRRSKLAMGLQHFRQISTRFKGGVDLDTHMEQSGRIAAWLESRWDALLAAGVPEARLLDLRLRLGDTAAVVERRRALRGKARLLRVGPALRMLRAGDYRNFNGAKAALKDIFI